MSCLDRERIALGLFLFLIGTGIASLLLGAYLTDWRLDFDQPLFVRFNRILSLVFFSLSGVVFFRGLKSPEWDPFSPQRLFFAQWFFLLGLCNLRLSRIEEPFTLRVWLMILGALLAFYVGGRIASASAKRSRWVPVAQLGELCRPQWSFGKAVYLLLGLFLVASAAMGYQLVRFGELPIFSSDVEIARNTFAVNSYVQRFAITFYVIVPLCYICLAYFRKWGVLFLTIGFLSLLIFFLTATFYFVINSLAIVALLYRYMEKRLSARAMVLLLLLVVSFKLAVDTFRFYRTNYYDEIAYRTEYPTALVPLAPNYFYLTMNLQTFQHLTEMIPADRPHTYGWFISYPVRVFWTRVGLEELGEGRWSRGRISDLLWAVSWERFGFPSVTTSYLGDPYADFGWPGVVVYSFLFGWVATWWYGRLRSQPSFWRLFIYAQICFGILLSFMSAYFDLFDVYWSLLVVAIFHHFARRPQVEMKLGDQPLGKALVPLPSKR